MKIKSLIVLLAICLSACTGSKYAGVPNQYQELISQTMQTAGSNAKELKKALKQAPTTQREGMAFLISYMPERDAKTLTADFLLENVAYAYKARAEFPWAKEVPNEIFLNDVLAYVNLSEKRENWRKEFYERFKKYVANCKTMREAIDSVNKNVRDELLVDYNTKRERADQAPYESMRQHMASCSGLSILLTDAFRAVGIPSRVAGTPAWYDDRGNHNWSEVWVDGNWHFTEYYPSDDLDKSWFLADAGKAIKEDVQKAVYAASFKPTGYYFPLVWDQNIRYVHAENVTDRYTSLYRAQLSAAPADEHHVDLRVMVFKDKDHADNSGDRVATNLDVFKGEEKLFGGRSTGATQDMNDVLTFKVEKNQSYTVKFMNGKGELESQSVEVGDQTTTLKLYMK
ncbi:MAG: transglutaminase-like domain-containing protein [Prevotella sp.]|uniref:transglutaminase-like domain-containing protein n=1 Tax=Prevotella sp. TaxID=59823 RepID=UPI0025ED6590|nr:transglutaminase-like domain-containing protein [Prevotella sp.]MCI7183327.1 transglutaminase-like domain-containing protein [Prevotella sp.]